MASMKGDTARGWGTCSQLRPATPDCRSASTSLARREMHLALSSCAARSSWCTMSPTGRGAEYSRRANMMWPDTRRCSSPCMRVASSVHRAHARKAVAASPRTRVHSPASAGVVTAASASPSAAGALPSLCSDAADGCASASPVTPGSWSLPSRRSAATARMAAMSCSTSPRTRPWCGSARSSGRTACMAESTRAMNCVVAPVTCSRSASSLTRHAASPGAAASTTRRCATAKASSAKLASSPVMPPRARSAPSAAALSSRPTRETPTASLPPQMVCAASLRALMAHVSASMAANPPPATACTISVIVSAKVSKVSPTHWCSVASLRSAPEPVMCVAVEAEAAAAEEPRVAVALRPRKRRAKVEMSSRAAGTYTAEALEE
mmetsp:Transcript_10073/g.29753  ORF Transcript_10073/g.29753 Transcript_10073/m.29753 type:complete len:380 (-) Transcript_10073:883-2022(-)